LSNKEAYLFNIILSTVYSIYLVKVNDLIKFGSQIFQSVISNQ